MTNKQLLENTITCIQSGMSRDHELLIQEQLISEDLMMVSFGIKTGEGVESLYKVSMTSSIYQDEEQKSLEIWKALMRCFGNLVWKYKNACQNV